MLRPKIIQGISNFLKNEMGILIFTQSISNNFLNPFLLRRI